MHVIRAHTPWHQDGGERNLVQGDFLFRLTFDTIADIYMKDIFGDNN